MISIKKCLFCKKKMKIDESENLDKHTDDYVKIKKNKQLVGFLHLDCFESSEQIKGLVKNK